MGWSGSLTATSAVGSKITFTPDTSAEGGYTVSSFTAPRKGVYRFDLKGSGGSSGEVDWQTSNRNYYYAGTGGTGGKTTGYLLLEKNQTVYVGAGGTCSAAFAARSGGDDLASVAKADLYFVAGAGGQGGSFGESKNNTGWNCYGTDGGAGGGSSGGNGKPDNNNKYAYGGTQNAGGATGGEQGTDGGAGTYGTGGARARTTYNTYIAHGGRGGDGYYGGGGGRAYCSNNDDSARGYGGGGGSGYVRTASLTVLGRTYTSSTSQSGGAAAGSRGSVAVTYYARALLPVFFDGTQLEKIFFNGTELESLTYNGTVIYMRRWADCLRSMAERFVSRAATRGLFRSASAA